MFPLINFSLSYPFGVSSIKTLWPNLSNFVSMVGFSTFLFLMVCNYFLRWIFLYPFSLSSFKIAFPLILQNCRLFGLPKSIHFSWVSFDNSYGVNLETTLDKWSFSVETWLDSSPIEEGDEAFSFDFNSVNEPHFHSAGSSFK